jgi:FkbM family methyltransferase
MAEARRYLFKKLSRVSRGFGGVRPRRLLLQLGAKAYESPPEDRQDYDLWTDSYGSKLWLHPHFHIDRYVIALGSYEPALHEFIKREIRRGDVFFDVGANIGTIAIHAGHLVGPDGKVFAFEPIPEIARRLEDNLLLNPISQVKIYDLALSNHNGQVSIYRFAGDNHGMSSLVSQQGGDSSNVRCATLDHFVAVERLTRLDWIKLDIQGAEPLFVEGALQTIEKFRPKIVTEVSETDLRDAGVSSRDYLRLWFGLGYTAFPIGQRGQRGKNLTLKTVDEAKTNYANLLLEPL